MFQQTWYHWLEEAGFETDHGVERVGILNELRPILALDR